MEVNAALFLRIPNRATVVAAEFTMDKAGTTNAQVFTNVRGPTELPFTAAAQTDVHLLRQDALSHVKLLLPFSHIL